MSHTQKNSADLFWVHYIRAIAAFGVVFVHVAADVITEWGSIPVSHWWFANIFDSLTRGCVSLFIMVSGALLLPVQEGVRDFFRKRFNRILIPFLAWTVLYLFWKKAFYRPDLGLSQSVSMVLDGGVWFHMWFFYILAGMYLMAPVLRIFMAHATRAHVGYFLWLWFLCGSCVPFSEKFARLLGYPGFHVGLPVAMAEGFIGYFILGAFLVTYAVQAWTALARVVWASCFLFCCLGTGWMTTRTGTFQDVFYDNLAPNIVLYCASFFVLVKFIVSSSEDKLPVFLKGFVIDLSKASLGVYLIHPMIIDVLDKGRLGVAIKPSGGHPLIMIPAISVGIYFVSFFFVRFISKIPYLKRIV